MVTMNRPDLDPQDRVRAYLRYCRQRGHRYIPEDTEAPTLTRLTEYIALDLELHPERYTIKSISRSSLSRFRDGQTTRMDVPVFNLLQFLASICPDPGPNGSTQQLRKERLALAEAWYNNPDGPLVPYLYRALSRAMTTQAPPASN